MEKLDLKRTLKHLYSPSAGKVELVDVPEFKFVTVDGTIGMGETPASSEGFQNAVGALYGASFTLKFESKLRKENPIDYAVMPLEGLWWVDSGEFAIPQREPWHYTLMILQPDHITEEMFRQAVERFLKKKDNPAVPRLRFEPFHEGLSIQTMHIGPYSDEPKTIELIQTFAAENGYRFRGRHHEIYMGDPRRAAPEKLKTVLRCPVEKLTQLASASGSAGPLSSSGI